MTNFKIWDEFSYMLPLDTIDSSYLGHKAKDWTEKSCLWSPESMEGVSKYYQHAVSGEIHDYDKYCIDNEVLLLPDYKISDQFSYLVPLDTTGISYPRHKAEDWTEKACLRSGESMEGKLKNYLLEIDEAWNDLAKSPKPNFQLSDQVLYVMPLDTIDLSYLGYKVEERTERSCLWSKEVTEGELKYSHIETSSDNEDYYVTYSDTEETINLEFKISDQLTYMLPLDAIDISYLDHKAKGWTDKACLWSKESMIGEAKYYEVEISTEIQDYDDTCIVESENFKCHICNTEVPLAYADQHNNSEKHKTYQRLIERVFDRARKQIKSNYANNKTNIALEDAYYCETCCIAVNKNKKILHLGSDFHKKSKENYKALTDFMKTFNGEETKDDFNDMDVIIRVCDDELKVDNKENVIEEKGSDEDKNYTDTGKIDETINAETKVVHQNPYRETFDQYIRNYVKNNKLKLNYETIETTVTIANNDGSRLKVSFDNYFSYKDMNGKQYCLICQVSVPTDRQHDITETHLKNILKPFNECYAREIDRIFSHCLVCNEIILNLSEHHNINENHKYILKSNMLPDVNKQIVNSNISNVNETTTTGQTITKNGVNIWAQTSLINDIKNCISEFKFEINKSKQLTCIICNVVIFNVDTIITKHVNDNSHLKNKETLLMFNKIVKNKTGYRCSLCKDDSLRQCQYMHHVNSDIHTTNLSKTCCKQTFRSYIHNFGAIKAGERHLHPSYLHLYDNLMRNNDIKKNNQNSFKCNICSCTVSKKNEIDHALGYQHSFQKKYQK